MALTNILFREDWAKHVTSRKTALPPSSHVIQLTGIIFKLNSHIKDTNVLTKFHENLAKNKNAPPTGGHVFSPIWTIFKLVRDINKTNVLTNFHDDWAKIETNVLTKFHENWAKNVTSRVFTCFHYIHIEKNAPPTCGHVFSPIWTIFELVGDTNKTNVLTNFHDDWAKIVTSRVKTALPPPSSHVIKLTGTIFKLNFHIKETNVLTKFHENWAKNVIQKKNAPPTGGHVFSQIRTIFELVRDINKTNVLTNFHDDWAKIETNVLTKFHDNWAKNVTSRVKNAPPTCGHVFSPIWTIFELVRDANKTNVLTNFHDDWAKIVTSRVFTSSHVIQLTRTIFKLNFHIKETNVLTKFHENWAKNKNAPPTGGHVFSQIRTIFELVRDINKTNVLTNFHDDWAKIVTSRVFTSSHETNVLTKFHKNWAKIVTSRVFTCFHYIHLEKMPRPLAAILSPTWTLFELVRVINKTNVLTNFHDDWAKIPNKENCTPTGGHGVGVDSRGVAVIFVLSNCSSSHCLNTFFVTVNNGDGGGCGGGGGGGGGGAYRTGWINNLTKFHKDWMKTATSIVYTRDLSQFQSQRRERWRGEGCRGVSIEVCQFSHCQKKNKLEFQLIINILTKFHKDWMKTVTSTVYTIKLLTDARTHNGRRTSHGHISSPCHFMTEKKLGLVVGGYHSLVVVVAVLVSLL
ncbi:hypothetical protein DPMN_011491 [Dreissena polymorpha]|uniref:Uncharacterized protein n=1 Tax=Dreissena polymorpha TaxID=45954 RepID=A0A9D4S022_DREPO|nr:hypothetical protein DPMN_011491 [Dreissena polymorpha]